ncbi:MAG: endonuclease [Capnocytophaga sp.]|nr:endonuclease [Capnocytophaga sp.]
MKKILFLLIPFLTDCDSNTTDKVNNPPSNFTVQTSAITENVATISWFEATDSDGDKVSYIVTKDDFVAKGINRLNYTFSNLIPNTTYYITITATDGKGGETSISHSFTTQSTNSSPASFSIPSELQSYYQSVDFSKTGTELYDQLASLTIGKHSTFLNYSERHNYLPTADKSESDASKVVLIYTGDVRNSRSNDVNTEHVYPQSKIETTAKGDLHHLRYCDVNTNSTRGNYPFTNDSGNAKLVNNNSWYPGDTWRGDVARMVLYLSLRYNEDMGADISTEGIDLLLKWNAEDPVSQIEKNRNNVIQQAQGNRNPFIDNPYLATLIWGKFQAENRWKK